MIVPNKYQKICPMCDRERSVTNYYDMPLACSGTLADPHPQEIMVNIGEEYYAKAMTDSGEIAMIPPIESELCTEIVDKDGEAIAEIFPTLSGTAARFQVDFYLVNSDGEKDVESIQYVSLSLALSKAWLISIGLMNGETWEEMMWAEKV